MLMSGWPTSHVTFLQSFCQRFVTSGRRSEVNGAGVCVYTVAITERRFSNVTGATAGLIYNRAHR